MDKRFRTRTTAAGSSNGQSGSGGWTKGAQVRPSPSEEDPKKKRTGTTATSAKKTVISPSQNVSSPSAGPARSKTSNTSTSPANEMQIVS